MSATLSAPVSSSAKAVTFFHRDWPFYVLFFISGFPALLYQIVWQRSLFTLYGVNIQSVTVIVTVFMLGLGLGSLAGGKLSAVHGLNTLRAFGVIEFSIGIFGVVSLPLFHWIATFTAGVSAASTAVISFILLSVPTLLMGSTLPLLVEYRVRRTNNVGDSIGSLYSVNTLGSAVACFVSSTFLMRTFGQAGSVRIAAATNLIVGSAALVLAHFDSKWCKSSRQNPVVTSKFAHKTIPLLLGMILSGTAGFIALAYEILWYHIYSFASGSRAPCFAMLLGFYLLGIAYGSFAVHEQCQKALKDDLPRTMRAAAVVVCLGGIAAFLVIPATAHAVQLVPYELTFVFVSIASALLGATFPLICHASIGGDQDAGRNVSYLYVSNIIGSALGSFTIGFVALDHLSTAGISLVLLPIGIGMACVLAWWSRPLPFKGIIAAASGVCVTLVLVANPLFDGLFERLMFKSGYRSGAALREIVENRSGVITVDKNEFVYGGGVYDGAFRIDPLNDTNGIFRAFAIAAMHPGPRHVLVIGLSSGSWTQVLANHPTVEDVIAVEINPGYLPLIQERPVVSSLLQDRKVHIEIDDGRRWLLAHPEARFDFILMNTTHHWRANASNLLSVEFLQLIRRHLNPGGILYYNTTSSERVQLTGATVFPYALRVANFIAVSDRPIVFNRTNWKRTLEAYKINGRLVFDLSNAADRECIDRWTAMTESEPHAQGVGVDATIEDRASILRRLGGRLLISDDNMGTEWE